MRLKICAVITAICLATCLAISIYEKELLGSLGFTIALLYSIIFYATEHVNIKLSATQSSIIIEQNKVITRQQEVIKNSLELIEELKNDTSSVKPQV